MTDLIERLREEARMDGARWEGCSELMIEAADALEAVREAQKLFEWNAIGGPLRRRIDALLRDHSSLGLDREN